MKLEEIKVKVDKLILQAEAVLQTKHRIYDNEYLSSEAFSEFRVASLSFLERVFGLNHTFHKEFQRKVDDSEIYKVEQGRGILKAAKQEIDSGWISNVRALASAELFSSFLEMAEHLLEENYKDPAAVMVGSVLEEHLKQLAAANAIELSLTKGDREIPKKADLINTDLASATIYNKLDQKSVTAWLDLRNKAAHGKYSEYSKEQVDLMYQGVVNFIARTT